MKNILKNNYYHNIQMSLIFLIYIYFIHLNE
jgi:hypothetical protein